jgi:hypothetical protein
MAVGAFMKNPKKSLQPSKYNHMLLFYLVRRKYIMRSSGDTEKIGLLLVHGIGDQARFQHLQTVGDQIVKALAFEFGRHNIAVEMFPGLENRAPLSILVNVGAKHVCFDLHKCGGLTSEKDQKPLRYSSSGFGHYR